MEATIERLFFEGFSALGRKDLPPHPFTLPFDWAANPFSDRNWMFQLHGWRVLDAFFNRMAPHDVAFIGKVMSDWWRFYQEDPEAMPWYWYDMSTGLRASKIAYLVHWCEEQSEMLPLAPEVLQGLVESHLDHLTNPEELNHGNHGLFQLNGLMALVEVMAKAGKTLPREEAAREFAVTHMREILKSQLGDEGVHTEDSPDYHFFALTKIRQILEAPWLQRDDMADIRTLCEKAEIAKEWLVTPTLHCPPVGDSAEALKLKRYARLREWPHQALSSSLAARLDGYGVVRSQPEVPLEQSHYLFFQGSFHTSDHKHADCLSFVWQEKGRYRLWDSGKYGYQKGEWRDYFLSTRAHNTLEVDGQNTSRQKRDAYGSAIQHVGACDDGWLLVGKVSHPRLKITHQRVLYYRPGTGVEVLDIIHNDQPQRPRDFRWWWHLGPNTTTLELSSAGACFEDASDQQRLMLEVASTLESAPKARSHHGQQEPRLAGWFSPSYLETQPSQAVSFHFQTRQPRFAVVSRWSLGEQGAAASMRIEQGRLHVASSALYRALSELLEPGIL
ncbi:heparinase II/III family protein [Marinobacter bryozoorum]|uniref:alginate lyase family protein n=1 Tax=Marinobacter bryozoorum TaxID=256324 RepID=UPI0020049A93|nr:alginate lyase family protein [Marinobacter bryozoorum]MCK7546200.1 heparinase II/III family protein [Marinobacter bryozoorum]